MIVWKIEPLPDFLCDHTLPGSQLSDRLRDVVARWVQLIASLWSWRDRASFALRYVSMDGRTSIYLLAVAYHHAETSVLSDEIAVLLRAHRLCLLPVLQGTLLATAIESWRVDDCAICEICQAEVRNLWQPRPNLVNAESFRQQFPWLSEREIEEPLVIYPWWAPGGAFTVPMESLISQPVRTILTVYLSPTQLMPHEAQWLAAMAREAQSKGEQTLQQVGVSAGMRVADPAASLAGRLYIANLRRLSTTPMMVNVHCAAASNRIDATRSIAGTVQALVQESPFDRPQQDDERLPSAAMVASEEAGNREALSRGSFLKQFQTLRFPSPTTENPLIRLRYLADARGAATVFRLPISVRGGVPGIHVRQLPPDFHPGPRITQLPPNSIELGRYQDGGLAHIPKNDLCKHALITGFTGSGKTVTVLQLLHQLWVDHRVPFLVLESAKQEYRGLLGVQELQEDLRVYTLGNELCVPFRLNPFELLPGIRVEAHLSKLQVCFEGAIPPIGPSSSVITEALLRVYETLGWSLTDVCPVDSRRYRSFPTMSDFVDTVEEVLNERGYEGEVQSNLKAALIGRFRPLLLGGKGRMFDTQGSHPNPEALFSKPTILEMNDLSIDDKALVVMFLLTILREFRERNRNRPGELVHITVVEEAHNVLENVASQGSGEGATSADTRFKAVEAFCQLLTEIRALGEGLVIADQSPEKLARDALRNTNLQIAHQLRDSHDRSTIASAMIMEKEQQDFLGKLRPGQAAMFRTGLEKATFIQVDPYTPTSIDAQSPVLHATGSEPEQKAKFRGVGFRFNMSDELLVAQMKKNDPHAIQRRSPIVPFDGCLFCQSQCRYRDPVMSLLVNSEFSIAMEAWFENIFENDSTSTPTERWVALAKILKFAVRRAEIKNANADTAWCLLVHSWSLRYGATTPERLALDEDMYESCIRHVTSTQGGNRIQQNK